MFKGNRERHYQLMAELRALEAQDAGIQAARVISPPKDKLSLGKALMFLGGLSAATYFLVFSDQSPFSSSDPAKEDKKKSIKEGSESYEILNQIRYGEMDDGPAVSGGLPQLRSKTGSQPPTSGGFLDAALSRASLLGGGK